MNGKPILCLDFDGVLHSYTSGWKGARKIPDPPVPGAMKFLVNMVRPEGQFAIAIHSSRSSHFGGRRAIRRWLRAWLTEYFWQERKSLPGVFTGTDAEELYQFRAARLVNQIGFPLWKPPARVTLDDRAITFSGVWPSAQELLDFKPWNRR